MPGALAVSIATFPYCGISVGKPRPITTVFGRLTSIGPVKVVDPRGQDQVLPASQRVVDDPHRRGGLRDEEPV